MGHLVLLIFEFTVNVLNIGLQNGDFERHVFDLSNFWLLDIDRYWPQLDFLEQSLDRKMAYYF